MAKVHVSTKRLMIDKTNARIVIITAVAAFIVVFTLVAAKALISQAAYQNKVINKNKTAKQQLKDDIQATNSLVTSYQAFVSTSQNALGGNPTGNGGQDGDNATIVLDALPSEYDFPALATSLEKLIVGQRVQIASITGTDDEIAQSGAKASAKPAPVPMPFQVSVTGTYQNLQSLVGALNKSIRPFKINTLQISGDQKSMNMTISAETYYQPAKSLNITEQVVK
ncbi:MAG TPA: type 4a pilus biogenesis protein PilO [Candidatus Saccharimonadales bacterium]|nr:type 4a pilus biogenesis protein PilO [Candidatus Saccharimonadales bacterium]